MAKGEFQHRVHVDDPKDVLWRVFCELRAGNLAGALDLGAQYYSTINAQAEVETALAAYKKYLETPDE